MKIGYILCDTQKKPAGIDRLIKGCIDEMGDYPQVHLNILGYDYLNLKKCVCYPALYLNCDLINRRNELNLMLHGMDIDIVHTFYYPFTGFKNVKNVLTIHDLTPLVNVEWFLNKKEKQDFFDIYLRQASKDADCIFANSYYTRSDIIKYYDIDPEKIKVIYPGCYDIKQIDAGISKQEVFLKYGIKKDYILSVCTVEPRKNLVSLIKAYEILRSNITGYDIQLVLTGRSGWKNDDIYYTFAQSRYSSDIIFTGYVSDSELSVLYKNSLLFAYISYYEGFGSPILEAMANGAAVLTSKTSSMPEVGGDAVYYCDPYDLDSIVDQLEYMLYDESLRIDMKKKALIQAKRFSYRKMADETIKVYKGLLDM